MDGELPFVSDHISQSEIDSFNAVERDPTSWSGALPASQGLYQNEYEKDACGVGFICHIKGEPSHKIVSDARQLLCAMTHRGATGADSRDGDGAGVMTGIPHYFFKREAEKDIGCTLPDAGQYAVGNVFFKAHDPVELQKQQAIFSSLATEHGLRVLGWREVPTDGTILGPAASSKEPVILQPFVVFRDHYGTGSVSQGGLLDLKRFERQLYVLRKHATNTLYVHTLFIYSNIKHVFRSGLSKGFYICSLSTKNIIYKGQLSPPQVYNYYHDLNHVLYRSHFTLVHSRFSTNTFPSWDRAQPFRWAAHNGTLDL
jgi:glutamate synthase (NADPH/NADH)